MIDGFTMFYILKNADFSSAHMYIYVCQITIGWPANNKNEVMGSMLIYTSQRQMAEFRLVN